jgi:hypothetical protein
MIALYSSVLSVLARAVASCERRVIRDLFLLFLAELLESGIGTQKIQSRSKLPDF